jgi:hypothetical protein
MFVAEGIETPSRAASWDVETTPEGPPSAYSAFT